MRALKNGHHLIQRMKIRCCLINSLQIQDYCAPKINYADVRKRVQHAFVEKANEIADAIGVVQRLSKEGASLVAEIKAQCA